MDPKELALEHFEKAILGVAVLILIFVGVLGDEPKELKESAKLNQQMQGIDAYMANPKSQPLAKPTWVADLKSNLDPEEVKGDGGELPKWLAHRRPGFLFTLPVVAEKQRARHLPPVEFTGDASKRGKIGLKWRRHGKNRLIVIDNYVVERRIGEKGKWSSLGRVKGEDEDVDGFASYVDSTIESRKKYYYRVKSLASINHNNEIVEREGTTLDPDEAEQHSDVVGPFATKRDVFIVPQEPCEISQRVALELGKDVGKFKEIGYATLKVFKWDSVTNKFISHTFYNVKEDSPIGKKRKKGKWIDDVRKKRIDGKRREINFGTGAVLKEVTIRTYERKVKDGDEVKSLGTFEYYVVKYQFEGEDELVEATTRKEDRPKEIR